LLFNHGKVGKEKNGGSEKLLESEVEEYYDRLEIRIREAYDEENEIIFDSEEQQINS
jgi:hypothetical protein